jgi:hypothetical protein
MHALMALPTTIDVHKIQRKDKDFRCYSFALFDDADAPTPLGIFLSPAASCSRSAGLK